MARPADPHAKEALAAAARAEFARRGLRGARVEDITAACGLSKGSFYLHFESKEALFKELVEAFVGEIAQCSDQREGAMHAFIDAHGALTPRDLRERSDKFRRWDEMELEEDVEALEILWRWRDVFEVLITGVAGTPFETTIWEMLDREQARIAENHRNFQGSGCLRADVAPELFGALIVGTYFLVAKRMARASEKPDLASMARSLQTLIHEGAMLRDTATRGRNGRDPRASAESQGQRAKISRKQSRTTVRSSR